MLTPICRKRTATFMAFAATLLTTSCYLVSAAQATPVEFANFHLLNANQPLCFPIRRNSGSLVAESVPVVFNFTTQSGLPTTDHFATLTINPQGGPSTVAPAIPAGPLVDQPINVPTTMLITEDGTNANLLTMTFTGNLSGTIRGTESALTGAESLADLVTYTSSFGTFQSPGNSYNLGLATADIPLSIGPGGFLNSFIANVNGQFSANFTANIPEPSSLVLLGLGLATIVGPAIRQRRR